MGGSTDRPGLQQLLADVNSGRIDIIVVYKVYRLTETDAETPAKSGRHAGILRAYRKISQRENAWWRTQSRANQS